MWPIQSAFLQSIVCKASISLSTLCNTSFFTQMVQLIFSILLQHHITELPRHFWSTFKSVPSFSIIRSCDSNMLVPIFLYFNNFLKTTDILLPPTSHDSASSNANAIWKENVTKLSNSPTVIQQSSKKKKKKMETSWLWRISCKN
jgi:hypothetical protein